ncbi:MAG: large conductance mechanosensitive channel protein MscL [Actinomycetota bacterium]
MFKEFKAFALRGNVVDLAIGVMIGVAFNAMVTSLVNDVLMNFVAAVFGEPDFNGLRADLGRGVVRYGAFLTSVVNFAIVALTLFVLVKAVNRLVKRTGADPEPPSTRPCPFCMINVPVKATRCSGCTSELPPPAEAA